MRGGDLRLEAPQAGGGPRPARQPREAGLGPLVEQPFASRRPPAGDVEGRPLGGHEVAVGQSRAGRQRARRA